MNVVEESVSKEICNFDVVDNNPLFLNYIVARSKYGLANKIKIEIKPGSEFLALENVANEIKGRKVYFYGGRDQSTIMSFGNENSYLLHLSQSNPRRQIQIYILRQKGIEEVPDHPKIIKLIDRKDLSYGEVSVMLRISTILSEDYLLVDNQIQFAEIIHQVLKVVFFFEYLAEQEGLQPRLIIPLHY